MHVRVILSGRNYPVAEAIPDSLALPEGASLDDALRALSPHVPGAKGFPQSCLVAVSGTHLGTVGNHAPHVLVDGDELLLIVPVAGG